MVGEEADAAEHYRKDPVEWYELPRWARAGMVAQMRKRAKIARWREIWSTPKKRR